MTEHPTVLAVAEKVRDAMNANGGDRKKAIQRIADDLAPDRPATVRDLWAGGFGYYAVERAASDVLRHAPAYMSDNPPPPPSEDLPDNWGTSRWEKVDPMEIPVAVGNTGVSKKWGDLTREDLTVIATFRENSGKTLLRQAQRLKAMSMKVHEDRTLRDALAALDTEERGVIEEIAKVRFPADAAEQAA